MSAPITNPTPYLNMEAFAGWKERHTAQLRNRERVIAEREAHLDALETQAHAWRNEARELRNTVIELERRLADVSACRGK